MKKGIDLEGCTRCRVYTPKGKSLAEARVVCTNDDKVAIYFMDYTLSDSRMRTRVDFFTVRQGLVMTLCEVTLRRNPAFPQMLEPWMGEVKILEVKQVVQRQQDIRCKVKMEVLFDRASGKGSFMGTILNLSAGGFYMTCRKPLEKKDQISFRYTFRTLERRFEATVIRYEKRSDGTFGYGCRFINLTDGGDSAIRSFVYKKQQEENPKQKEE